jgi:hypothetical protein
MNLLALFLDLDRPSGKKTFSLRTGCFFAFALTVLCLAPAPYGQAQTPAPVSSVRIYPAPSGEPLSTDFAVSVEGQSSPVYVATVGEFVGYGTGKPKFGTASFSSFDFTGTVQVSVFYHQPVTYAQVLPLSSGIVASISGNEVTFSISNPGQFVLEVNRMRTNSLQIFANAPEAPPRTATAKNPVLYFGPGTHQLYGTTFVAANTTVYVDGGAVIYGSPAPCAPAPCIPASGPIFFLQGPGIVFRGRGIIDGHALANGGNNHILYATGADGVDIEGVTLRDSGSWNLVINKTKGAQVSNVKEFGWRLNSDGIDVNSSSNVTISGSFLRTYDDLVAIKTDDPTALIPSTDITVQHMVLWNEKAHALTVGYEIQAPAQNILFTDCDIIRDTGHDFLLAVDNADGATVQGVSFQNINVEEVNGLMEVAINWTPASADPTPGEIDSVTFSNIQSTVPLRRAAPYANLVGYDPEHQINGVTFSGVMIGGEPLQASEVLRTSVVQQASSIEKVSVSE